MSFVTPAFQSEFGDAIIVPADGVWYIHNSATQTVLIIPAPEQHFRPDVVEAVEWAATHGHVRHYYADWRVLNAREIDIERGLFLPARGKSFKKLQVSSPNLGDKITESVDGMMYALTDQSIDITGMYRDGDLRPIYPQRNKERLAGIISHHEAGRYIMHDEGRVLVLKGDVLRALDSLGFLITAPGAYIPPDDSHYAPVIGGTLELEDGSQIYALTTSYSSGSGIEASADGRELFTDAVQVCWFTVDQALDKIEAEVDFFEPINHSRYPSWGEYLAQDCASTRRIRIAVSILRWHGISEADIQSLLNERFPKALDEAYNNVIQLMNTEHERALAREEWSTWQVRDLMRSTEQLSERLDAMEKYYDGETLARGPLEDLVAIINALDDLNARKA